MVLDDMRTEIIELKAKLKTVIAEEREACAKVLEDSKAHNFTLQQLANKIRARK